MIAIIQWDRLEKFIQVSGHFVHWSPVFLALIFLLKNESGEIGTQQIYGRFVKLFRENCGVKVGFIFEVLAASMDFLSSDHLWHLEDDPITLFQISAVILQDVIILGWLTVLIQK